MLPICRFFLLGVPRPACAFNIGTKSGSDRRSNIVGFTIVAKHWDNIEMLPGLSSANAFGIFKKEQNVGKNNVLEKGKKKKKCLTEMVTVKAEMV